MRPIHLAHLDKTRPVVILTRELVRPHLMRVTIAPITGAIRGLSTEAVVGVENGLQQTSVVSCDNITTIPTDAIGRHIGYLLPHQEAALSQAISAAFDLE
ncbi:mRNA interferase MazF3 [Mycobacterium kyorinense]|uniref:mRNA interferase MazF3 n=1 Tax=Mycobacterium kyorinense TaxID=487514 RepID=A0A1A2YU20_9MYCO|nr:type II toxin-antitoxin system PemK/MazF family toxin [Mycobacterium kyorinense]OBI40426.1 mRNA interferase MazF3 [Mycobacterium kyorinense]